MFSFSPQFFLKLKLIILIANFRWHKMIKLIKELITRIAFIKMSNQKDQCFLQFPKNIPHEITIYNEKFGNYSWMGGNDNGFFIDCFLKCRLSS